MSDKSWLSLALAVALLLAGCTDVKLCKNCNDGGTGPCQSSPTLAATAGSGEATLRWEPATVQRAAIKAWQYRRAVQGESWSHTQNTGPAAATAYVVSGLTNGVAYTFQVRGLFGAANFGCWSAAVSVVPRRVSDVMERMAKHQESIAKDMAKVVEGTAARQRLLQELGESGIAVLGAIATSTNELAESSAGIREGVAQVAESVDTAGEDVAAATRVVAQQATAIDSRIGALVSSVDRARQVVAAGLAEITERCHGCAPPPASCSRKPVGEVYFDHNSDEIGDRNAVHCIAEQLRSSKVETHGGLVLTEGYATAVGTAVYNLGLSDRRAENVAAQLEKCLSDGRFEFRWVAKGETFDQRDPAGTSRASRRVDVVLCEDTSHWQQPDGPRGELPDATACSCVGVSSPDPLNHREG